MSTERISERPPEIPIVPESNERPIARECSITLETITGEPIIGRLYVDQELILKCEKHYFSLMGMVQHIADKFWNNPNSETVGCPVCSNRINAIVIDVDSREEVYEMVDVDEDNVVTEVAIERVWRGKDYAPLADRLFDVFNEKIETDGDNAMMRFSEVREHYIAVTSTEDVEPIDCHRVRRRQPACIPSPRVDLPEIPPEE